MPFHTCITEGLDAIPCTISQMHAASIAYSIQHTAYSKSTKVVVQRARTHTHRPKTSGRDELPANALHLIRHRLCEHQATRWASANRGGMRWRPWGGGGGRAQGIQKNGEQRCMQRVALPVRSILLVVVGTTSTK